MNDSYQPIYDAVRSRIGNGDIGAAVEAAMRDANIQHYVERFADTLRLAVAEYERPSVLFRPGLSVDGNQWRALYGDNLQDGIAGFGDTPEMAIQEFDKQWRNCYARKQGAKP